ncbi:hypothetical protein K432DRAFT_405689 [Lepidopterella palustris CBS 459.81]|uniref:Xylanolytic transcriptional activator regulatory domain-containing protein n=1 Tax=Lepidopterella palustris CBS 459.81 TaxID=1314670 RepID=A0A8E2JER6_9PEZI|nr:hypothetical protein K432DRAFT_405689 [Lepidopterella palustris CBS 459.81]
MKDPANPPHFDFSNHNPGNMSESMLEIMARVSSLEREYNAMKNHISTAVDGDDAACSPDRATTTSSPTSSTISAISLPESERFHSASCLFTPIEVVNSTAAREDGKHPDYSVSSMETAYPSPKKVFWLNLQPVAPQSLESMEQETRMYDTAVLRRSFDIFFSHQNQHIPCVNEKQFRAQFDSFLQNDSEGSADQHQFVALVNLIHAQIVFLTGDWTDASKVPPAWDEFCRAENILNQLTWLGSGNILTIQCLLIKGLYLLYIENSDAAYNAMSQVVRLCFKLGLHDQSSWNCDSLELATRQKLFWTIFFLDRYISFNNGAPYLLRECDFDVELPELLPEESLDRSPVPFLSAAVKWAQLCSEIWDTVFAKKAQKAAVSEEFVASMDARILYSISRLPQHLQWANNRHRLKGTTDVPFYVLRQTVILHLLNNQLRLLLRQESILGQKYSIATANECVEIASNTIEALYDYHGIQQPIGRFASVFYSVSALLHLACIILGDHDSQKTRANAIEAFNKGLIMLQDLYPTFVLARHTFQRLCRIIDTVKRAMLKFNNTELQDPKEFPVPNLAATGFPQTTGFWSQDQPIDPNGDMIAQMSNGFSDSFWPTGVRVGWTTDELNVFCMDDDLRRLCDISGL